LFSFVMNEAMRDLRRAGRIGLAAILLIALSLTALGGFWLLSLNLGRAIDQWGDRVRVIVYLKDEPAPAKLDDRLQRIEAVGGIQRLRYVSKAEALRALKRSLGSQADVAEQLPRNPLPASVEVTPAAPTATPEGTRALVGRLATLREVEEVQG
jgi:cell division transport system permease protein